jgi:hypothetical protein
MAVAGIAAAAALSLAGAARANPVDATIITPHVDMGGGFMGFALSSHGGPVNPGVLVGFNPQPDPPGDTVGFNPQPDPPGDGTSVLDLAIPGNPIIVNRSTGAWYGFLFEIAGMGDGSVRHFVDAPNADGFTGFSSIIGGHEVDVAFHFSPGGDPASWVGFNPQPEPPGDFVGQGIFYAPDPWASFTMDIDGQRLSFSPGAPEPGAWALMLLGVGGLGAALRTQRRRLAVA